MNTVLAIDPGPTASAFVIWDGATIIAKDFVPNRDLRATLFAYRDSGPAMAVVIEKIECYGMPVGEEIHETNRQSGRFEEITSRGYLRCFYVPRRTVKQHLCHSAKAKDANITAALVDRFGNRERHGQFSKGTKRDPGMFYGFASHHWAALAVAVTSFDLRAWEAKETV